MKDLRVVYGGRIHDGRWCGVREENGTVIGEDKVVEAELNLDVHIGKHRFLDSNRTPDHRTHPSHFSTVLEEWDRRRQTTDSWWISASGIK
ncbi:hypothetical protein D8674_000053 [Pyrus ussuriensis x Pyrus communis]|uniref:Uncharacterized protein n=1 Tax=Pyrus ussuriensis x Pyrus communis TaxID=2448454 RepID=A0A5N5F2Y4_9ROSA|nr:hypothetical protein D8674_000053 [Pyrus ussuriensis x Pyrus communis]